LKLTAHVSFLQGNMGVTARNSNVKFDAVVNGEVVPCEVSEKPLKLTSARNLVCRKICSMPWKKVENEYERLYDNTSGGQYGGDAFLDSADFEK
jgi:hypothetical protein